MVVGTSILLLIINNAVTSDQKYFCATWTRPDLACCLVSREILGSSVDLGEGPPQQHTCFAELSAERHRRLATLRKRKQRSQCTKEAKRARREREKMLKKKACCGVLTSQV